MGKPNVAVVCSSNMNRSMEAHSVLKKKQFPTKSFGTGDRVKIPGRSAKEPNVYSFGTKITYKFIQTPLLYLLNHILNQYDNIFKAVKYRQISTLPNYCMISSFYYLCLKFDITILITGITYEEI